MRTGRPRTKVEPPALPRVTLRRERVTAREFDIAAIIDGTEVKRWPWWAPDRPRRKSARYMVLNGQRYEIEHC